MKRYNSTRLKEAAVRRQCPGCSGKNGLSTNLEGNLSCRYCRRVYSGDALPCTLERLIASATPAVVTEDLPVEVQPLNRLMPGWTDPLIAERYAAALERLTPKVQVEPV